MSERPSWSADPEYADPDLWRKLEPRLRAKLKNAEADFWQQRRSAEAYYQMHGYLLALREVFAEAEDIQSQAVGMDAGRGVGR